MVRTIFGVQPSTVVRTMSRILRHREVHDALAGEIARGDLASGERLPSERALQARFSCARSVVRQALAGLARDGLVMPAYPHGHFVVGARIPWLSRLRLLSSEAWEVRMTTIQRASATEHVAKSLQIEPGAPTVERHSELLGESTKEVWGYGLVHYAVPDLGPEQIEILMDRDEITYEHLERAFSRRITSYQERIRARLPTSAERKRLQLSSTRLPVLDVNRLAHTTTTPLSVFIFIGRADRFEADYLLQL